MEMEQQKKRVYAFKYGYIYKGNRKKPLDCRLKT